MSLIEKQLDLINMGDMIGLYPEDLFLRQHILKSLLSSVLPYNPEVKKGARLVDGLKEYYLLLTALDHSLACLEKGEWAKFDPLVGENSCQIRAVKLTIIFHKFNQKNLLSEVRLKRLKCKSFLKNPSPFIENGYSLQDLLQKETLEISLDDDVLFLLQSYLLTQVKVIKPFRLESPLIKNEYTDTKKIKEISPVGSMFADKLVKKLRGDLSNSSCIFVRELAESLEDDYTLKAMVSESFTKKHRNLSCLPCYAMTKILMHAIEHLGLPIAVQGQLKAIDRDYEIIQETLLFFKPTSKGYKVLSSSELPKGEPIIVFLGSTSGYFKSLPSLEAWRSDLITRGPRNLILAYAAAHRQYPCDLPDEILEKVEDSSYHYYYEKSKAWGCSMENASCFFLAHAYCDSAENLLKEFSYSNDLSHDLVEA